MVVAAGGARERDRRPARRAPAAIGPLLEQPVLAVAVGPAVVAAIVASERGGRCDAGARSGAVCNVVRRCRMAGAGRGRASLRAVRATRPTWTTCWPSTSRRGRARHAEAEDLLDEKASTSGRARRSASADAPLAPVALAAARGCGWPARAASGPWTPPPAATAGARAGWPTETFR